MEGAQGVGRLLAGKPLERGELVGEARAVGFEAGAVAVALAHPVFLVDQADVEGGGRPEVGEAREVILQGEGPGRLAPVALLFVAIFALYTNRFQIKPEEQVLSSLFGAEYIAYKARVRRWL